MKMKNSVYHIQCQLFFNKNNIQHFFWCLESSSFFVSFFLCTKFRWFCCKKLFWAVFWYSKLCPMILFGSEFLFQPENIDTAEYQETSDAHAHTHHQQPSPGFEEGNRVWHARGFLFFVLFTVSYCIFLYYSIVAI